MENEVRKQEKTLFLDSLEGTFKSCLDTAMRKNNDYAGCDSDPLKNFKLVENLGITSLENGILVRLCDKMSRIANLLDGRTPSVKDESIMDTLMDAIVYEAILIYYLQRKGRKDAE